MAHAVETIVINTKMGLHCQFCVRKNDSSHYLFCCWVTEKNGLGHCNVKLKILGWTFVAYQCIPHVK